MSDNRILPKNFWTEHQYNVGMNDGKEIKCYGHRITDKKMMDDLLRKSLNAIKNTAIGNTNILENEIALESTSPQPSDLTKETLSVTPRDTMNKVKNLKTIINTARVQADEGTQKMASKLPPVPAVSTVPAISTVPAVSTEPAVSPTTSPATTLSKNTQPTTQPASESMTSIPQQHLEKAIAAAGDAAKSAAAAATSTLNAAQNTAKDGIAKLKTTGDQASTTLKQAVNNIQTRAGEFLSNLGKGMVQKGGRKTKRRRRRRKRKTKHKRKKKRSTRKRKKRTRRRR